MDYTEQAKKEMFEAQEREHIKRIKLSLKTIERAEQELKRLKENLIETEKTDVTTYAIYIEEM